MGEALAEIEQVVLGKRKRAAPRKRRPASAGRR
jgi:hypothetical protein